LHFYGIVGIVGHVEEGGEGVVRDSVDIRGCYRFMAAEEASMSKCMRSPTPRELQQHGPSWVLARESFGLGCYDLVFSFICPEPKASFMPARVIEIAKRDKNGVFVSIVQVIARNNITPH
jgi:hypothetical protein